MFLPSDLSPLPVSPRGESAAGDSVVLDEDFVRAGDIRRLLLGESAVPVVDGLSAVDLDSFAGRSDVVCPSLSRPAPAPSVSRELHPAFASVPPLRRAAPPRARETFDCESGFGRAGRGDHWWVLGMGLAVAAVLFSGTLVDFVSREALRRSLPGVAPVSRVMEVAPAAAGTLREEDPQAIAAAPRSVDVR